MCGYEYGYEYGGMCVDSVCGCAVPFLLPYAESLGKGKALSLVQLVHGAVNFFTPLSTCL